jgi:hypothetical protein
MYFQQNVFERGTIVPGHSQFSLEVIDNTVPIAAVNNVQELY